MLASPPPHHLLDDEADEPLSGAASVSATSSGAEAALLWLDMSGRVSRWSPACERTFGRASGQALGTPFEDLLLSDGNAAGRARSALDVARERGAWDGVAWWKGADGRPFWGAATVTRVVTPNGLDIGYMVVVQDLRRLQLSTPVEPPGEEMLRLASVGRLASDVSHDLRNILAAIRGFAVLLEQDLQPGRLAHQAWYELIKTCDRGSTLTEGLLGVGRGTRSTEARCDVRAVLDGLRPLLRQVLPHRIRLEVDASAGLPAVPMPADVLERSLLNLVVNARDAIDEEGEIRLTASLDYGAVSSMAFVRIQVTDSGHGMSPDVLDRACERTFTTRAGDGGSGLGLAIVRDAVVEAGGTLSLDSGSGSGTTVTLSLPRADALAPDPRSVVAARARRTTALVCCDAGTLCECVTDLLRREGVAVTRCACADVAAHLAREGGGFDLVLVEAEGGCDVAHLREVAQRRGARTRLVGFTSPGAPEASAAAGFDAVLGWPFAPAELMATLRTVLVDERLESLN